MYAMSILGPRWYISLQLFFFQTALILISGKDGVMDLIYGGYSSDDAHISGITNDTLNLDSR
jgi:hypothetical protein